MDLAEQADVLPLTAGVYLFKDAAGEVLYVGKAVNLRARVRQYLLGHDERFMVRFLVAQAKRVEVVRVSNEKEALILENSLIKQHQPRYNIKLRDDKNFLHLRIDPRSFWPRFTLVRRPKEDGARYFGPYHSATHARRTLAFVQKSFPLRTCTDAVLRARKRPCLLHQMHRCIAPCVGMCQRDGYQEVLDDAVLFLGGRKPDLVKRLQVRMAELALAERYEDAARVRDVLKSVDAALETQAVADVKLGDRDAWGIFREGDRGAVAFLPVRGGLAREPRVFPFQGEVEDDRSLLSAALNTWYDEGRDVPPEVLLPVEPADRAALSEVLSERRGSRVEVCVPKRGDKTRLVDMANAAAETRFQGTHSEDERLERALETIAEIVGLDALPYRMECFDNSNLLGEDPVASQVVFVEGRPARSEYRRYKVKTVVGADDYATMREILGRRLRRAAEEGTFPDLLVVDGGRGQLSAAEDVLRELGLEDQAVIGIAKPRTERRRGERDAVDKIILRGQAEPVILREDDPALRLLQHIRDEAHRTAIGFHRNTRSRSALQSELDALPGIGKTRRQALLRHFGSTRALRGATVEQIAAVPGFGTVLAEKVKAALESPPGAE
jgi:excinuclease ABC subunit C